MDRPEISLLLCTRDRCAGLAATLASIARAAAAGEVPVEAIVVDNGSRDATPEVLAAWAARQRFPVRIVREDRPGLSVARNAGLAHIRGRIVALTDDDCVLHPGYFAALARRFAEEFAPIVIGGRILPGCADDLPVTLKLEDHPMIADPFAFPGGFVMGANLAFSAEVPALVGRFDERFGAGAPFRSAEDTDFLFRAQAHGIAVEYDPTFAVDHHHGRRDRGAMVPLLAGYSFGDGALYAKHLVRDRRILAAIAADLRALRDDLRAHERPFAEIRAFYWFRLRHKARGFAAYLARAARDRIAGPDLNLN